MHGCLYKCLESSMSNLLYVCMGLRHLLFCIESSMHKLLYTCMGVETLVVLFKCIESSMHKLCTHAEGL
jgi:hypothetical protein